MAKSDLVKEAMKIIKDFSKWDRMFYNWARNLPDAPEEISEEIPDNNDGRSSCWWCEEPTIQKKGFTSIYDYCENCKK